MGIITYDQETNYLHNEDGKFVGEIFRKGDGLGPLIEERVNGWLDLSIERDKLREQVKILRDALATVTAGLQHANEGYSEDNFGDEIRAGLAALEATKEP